LDATKGIQNICPGTNRRKAQHRTIAGGRVQDQIAPLRYAVNAHGSAHIRSEHKGSTSVCIAVGSIGAIIAASIIGTIRTIGAVVTTSVCIAVGSIGAIIAANIIGTVRTIGAIVTTSIIVAVGSIGAVVAANIIGTVRTIIAASVIGGVGVKAPAADTAQVSCDVDGVGLVALCPDHAKRETCSRPVQRRIREAICFIR